MHFLTETFSTINKLNLNREGRKKNQNVNFFPMTFSIKIVLQTGFNKRQNNWTHHKTRWSRPVSYIPFHVREKLIFANLGNKRLKALPSVIAFILLNYFQNWFCFFEILSNFGHVGIFFFFKNCTSKGIPYKGENWKSSDGNAW